MAVVTLDNDDVSGIDVADNVIATTVPDDPLRYYGAPPDDPATQADYTLDGSVRDRISLDGVGFTYNSSGLLSDGTITSIAALFGPLTNGVGQNAGSSVQFTGTALPVSTLLSRYAAGQSIVPDLLGANNLYQTRTSDVTGSPGNDVFHILGPRYNYSFGIFPGQPPVDYSRVSVSGGGGQNTAAVDVLRTGATVSGGGGNETVQAAAAGITAQLVNVDRLQFEDGSLFETNASAGAQAALVFEGVLGRLPDPVNAGGFGHLADQSGPSVAGDALVATAEGQADTAGLDNAGYVARLYNDMLHRGPDQAGAAGWQQQLASGALSRGGVAALFAASPEAQTANQAAFAGNGVFAADPGAVDVLRAYEVLLGRAPEGSSLVTNTALLDTGGLPLSTLYTEMQSSPEFAGKQAANPYGLTSSSSYAAVYGATHGDAATATILPLITATGGVTHLPG